MIVFSVVVCTYNRSNQLDVLLRTLQEQDLSHDVFEVLIVDNNSFDDTHGVAQHYCNLHDGWRYYFEPHPGLSNARNRGWKEARGSYVGYTDDDCRLPSDWLSKAYKVAREERPGMFGGPYKSIFPEDKPGWIKNEYYSSYLGDEQHRLSEGEFLSGGNLFIRRDLLEALGGFDPGLGMNADRMGVGEEVALQMRMHEQMPDESVFADPNLFVYHFTPRYKLSVRYRAQRYYISGLINLRQNEMGDPENSPPYLSLHDLRNILKFILGLMQCAYSFSVQAIFRDREKYPDIRNYWFERSTVFFQGFGRFIGQFLPNRLSQ